MNEELGMCLNKVKIIVSRTYCVKHSSLLLDRCTMLCLVVIVIVIKVKYRYLGIRDITI